MAMANRSLALIVVLALAACRGQDQTKRSTPNYDVVSEGSASGVTSTINGPGEKPAPVTETNADTTTNFTLPNNPNPLGNETVVTSIAPIHRASQPRTGSNGMASSSPPIVTDTIGNTKVRSDSDVSTTTASSDTTTTATTTATTTTTPVEPETTSSAPKKKTDGGKRRDDQQQPPPPPPPTDTTGTQG